MDDIAWCCNKLLDGESKPLENSLMIKFLQQLSVLELDWVKQLTISEIISRRETDGMTSLNHDDENQRWP